MEKKRLARKKAKRPQMGLLSLNIHTDEKEKTRMFGQMQVTKMFQLSKLETADEAVANLTEFAENSYRFTTNMK